MYIHAYLEFMPFLIMEFHCTGLPFALLVRLWVKVYVTCNRGSTHMQHTRGALMMTLSVQTLSDQ